MKAKLQGVILYEGPSSLGPDDIVVIATGLDGRSGNTGTGGMIQVWVLLRDIHPSEGIKTGSDGSICGTCPFRAANSIGVARSCYVNPMGPVSVYRSYKAGKYTRMVDLPSTDLAIRIGAYGDPAAVPNAREFWGRIVKASSKGWTGYTSQWTSSDLSSLVMASVRSPDEFRAAVRAGWRTYRARLDSQPVLQGEAICPKTDEGNNVATCETCLLCDGTESIAKGMTAIVHGPAGVVNAARKALHVLA